MTALRALPPAYYIEAGMARLDGEKMSKSRGNLVFVSKLLSAGSDQLALQPAIISHHYPRGLGLDGRFASGG
jgi:cysteinyl-tRNA synthetase